ncbi:VanZ family protein [Ruegeria sediminis]|uniref:VanZ family protein n=1 Tax=Ruegeria sediminis TaxID=2583820 RepID=A0ABY2WW00_9RHOB|nr:VanZ family protein [Ruegeria sediminis]TMV06467.1 VanZ family protein [Ruegeria sediminis]
MSFNARVQRLSTNIQTLFARAGFPMTLLLMLVITVASLMPKGSAGDPGSADKQMHVIAYALAVLPAAVGASGPVVGLAAGIVAWGIAIELIQPLVGRSMNIADIAANTSGVLAGLLFAFVLRRLLGKWSG